jgi:hypothetical protein
LRKHNNLNKIRGLLLYSNKKYININYLILLNLVMHMNHHQNLKLIRKKIKTSQILTVWLIHIQLILTKTLQQNTTQQKSANHINTPIYQNNLNQLIIIWKIPFKIYIIIIQFLTFPKIQKQHPINCFNIENWAGKANAIIIVYKTPKMIINIKILISIKTNSRHSLEL